MSFCHESGVAGGYGAAGSQRRRAGGYPIEIAVASGREFDQWNRRMVIVLCYAPPLFWVKVIGVGEKTHGEYQHDILSYIAARERHRAGEVSDKELARLRQLAVEARAAGMKITAV